MRSHASLSLTLALGSIGFFGAFVPSVSAAGTIFACDDFTEATPTVTLASHTPTTYTGCAVAGFTWGLGGTGATLQIATSQQLNAPSGGRGWYFQSGGTAPDNADYTVQADFETSSNAKNSPGISVRWLTTGNKDKGYYVYYNAGTWALRRSDGGNTQTTLCSVADATAPSATTISLTATGTGATVSLVVQKNGVDIIGGTAGTCTDTSASRITITGAPGVINAFTDIGAQYLANWKATNAPITAPTVTTQDATLVATTTAQLNGTVTSLNYANVTVSGFAWGTRSDLSGGDTATTTGSGAFSSAPSTFTESSLTLTCNTTYYFRPYATNSAGDGLGTISSPFTTLPCKSTVTTQDATTVGQTSATFNGTITALGGSDVSTSGFAYGTDPTLAVVVATTTSSGAFSTVPSTFSTTVSTLSCNTTYYYRPYATNAAGDSFGTISNSFTTAACGSPPTVTTQSANPFATTTATLNGTITSTGTTNVTVRGFAYGTDSTLATVIATTTDTAGQPFSTGAYTGSLTNLTCNTTYYARAYATNSAGDGLGSISASFTTSPCVPTLTTQVASSVATTTATLNGTITSTGGNSPVVRGFAWGTLSTLSGGDTATTTDTAGQPFSTGAFTGSISGLTCNTTYYARPYASNSAGDGLGPISSSFTTLPCVATVTTQSASSVTATTATLNGAITATGGANAATRGFAWGTRSDLSGGDTATTTENGSFGAVSFTDTSVTFTCNTTYYSRAYAANPAGTSFGSVSSAFTTSVCPDTTFATDSFNRTNGDLDGTTASGGGTWTARDGTGTINIASNSVTSGSVAGRYGYYLSTSPTNANYSVQADIVVTTAAKNSLGVAGRMDTASNSQYWVFWNGLTNGWNLSKSVSGTVTSIGTSNTNTPTSVKTVTLTMSGSTISVYISGVTDPVISVTDTSISAAGRAGIYNAFSDIVAGDTLDNWSALNDTSGPVFSDVASSTSSTQATITWTTNEPATSRVEYGLTSAYTATTTLDSTATTTHSVALSGLTPTTTYHFRALSADSAGNQATSTDYTLLTSMIDNTPPSTPTNLSATAASASQINLSWTASTDNVAVTGYKVYRCAGSSCTPSVQVATSTGSGTTYSDTGLSASTAYVYAIAAYDVELNTSSASASATATTNAPTTYYASPTGSGSACSSGSPCSLTTGLSTMASGDVLVLQDGTYNTAMSGFTNGTAANYSVIKAQNDGGAIITQAFTLLHTNAYLQFEGIKFNYSARKNIIGNHVKFLRSAFEGGVATGNEVNVGIGTNDFDDTQYILLEDCWAYGSGGRYKIMIYNSDRVVLRRVVVRDDGGWTSGNSDPEAGIVIYESSNVSVQNAIVIDSDLSTYDNDNVGAFYLTGHAGNRASDNAEYLGSMAINNKKTGWNVDTDDGAVGLTLRDNVVYGQENNSLAQSNTSIAMDVQRFTVGSGGGVGVGNYGTKTNTILDSLFFGVTGSVSIGSNTITYTNTYNPADLSGTGITHVNPTSNGLLYLPRIETASTLKTSGQSGGQMGAQIVYKIGTSGTLWGDTGYNTTTSDNLWPWPYESRIKTDFATVSARGFATGNSLDGSSQTLTKYIWEYLGNQIPAGIYTATVPTITTQSASLVAITTAQLNGTVTALNNGNVTVSGFAWGTRSDLSGGDTATTTASGSFSSAPSTFTESSLTLTCNTTYYFRPYATNSAGTGYGSIETFTTTTCGGGGGSNTLLTIATPILSAPSASSITSFFALLRGTIDTTSGALATLRGFTYGTDATLTSATSTTESGLFTAGTYTADLSSLSCNTTYYARPYATNSAGTGTGPITSFSTLACTAGSSSSASPATTPSVSTPPPTTTSPSAPSSGLSPTQIASILDVLASFGADASVIRSVQAALQGSPVSSPAIPTPSFTRNLSLYDTGPDVKALQQYLNRNGYTVAQSGAGSPGNETTTFGMATYRALVKFQKANNITPSGYFGPKTRSAMNR